MTRHQLLGGLSAQEFLREYWQKRPLLIRQAVPGFRGFVSPRRLAALACRDDAQARLVSHRRGRWRMQRGPFTESSFERLPRTHWTLLVQEVNHHLDAAWELLQRFDFIPAARLDDLMVSYAAPHGGVGPHVDSYDVFLLQARGARRWQISAQRDHALIDNLPLKILRRFRAEQEWVLQPGDMLYLPPDYAHCGTAVSECMTYSIGFRAPTHQELVTAFLEDLQDRLSPPGRYADPDLRAPTYSSLLSSNMIEKVAGALATIRWRPADVERFAGRYLSTPGTHVFFVPPRRPLTQAEFVRRWRRAELRLDRKTRMLVRGGVAYLNGDAYRFGRDARRAMFELAEHRSLRLRAPLPASMMALAYQWYRLGFAGTARLRED